MSGKKSANSDKIKNNASSIKGEMEIMKTENKMFFVKESIVNEIKKGSYEAFLERVNLLVQENRSKIVGETNNSAISIFGTFKGHAIVVDEEYNMYRLHIENLDGDINLGKVEQIESIKKYTPEQIESELNKKLSTELSDVIAKEGVECDNNLKDCFDNVIKYKMNNNVQGYINLNRSATTVETEE